MSMIREHGGAGVELRALTKQYKTSIQPAVDAIDLDIRPGEFLTFLGPSGSGKTTTLNMIAGFVPPTSGRILLDGDDISMIPAHRREFGMVFQSYALFPHLNVAENVAYPLRQRRIAKEERSRLTHEALQLVDLADKASRMPSELSGGQQQRVALARAVVYSPRLLLLDEPLGALDRRLRQNLQGEIKRLHRELGLTFLFVTHDQDEAMSLSDRVVVFNEGRLEGVGAPADLYENPGTEFIATFLGESTRLSGTWKGAEYTWAGSRLRLGGQRSKDGDVLVVRPERMRISTSPNMVPTGDNAIDATVVDSSYLGIVRRIDLELADASRGLAVVQGPMELDVSPGQQVLAHWSPSDQVFVTRS